ncbi:MAG: hypothetical protein EXR72_17200 [Myxococcales bacterium]|nr:hypothetical protein [Myxococcales bacterium]
MGFLTSLTSTSERRIACALFLFIATLYLPFAGNYGLWDPWETHYSEVARQMLMRHDFVSQWWPGSPQDRNEFWSKPVLTFWLMAIAMKTTGLQRADHAFDGEMAVGWLSEWSVRMPFILCGIACVWATWELTRRLAGKRAALWAAIVLATSSQFFLVSRQAMTDMAFVTPIAVALCFAGLALILPPEEVEAVLPRRSFWRLSWPHAPVFYVLLALVLLLAIPELLVCSLPGLGGGSASFSLGRRAVRLAPVVPMLPYIALLLFYLWFSPRARCKRQIYLHLAFLMGGVATLAKGPAGIGLPVLVIFFYLMVRGELSRLLPQRVVVAEDEDGGFGEGGFSAPSSGGIGQSSGLMARRVRPAIRWAGSFVTRHPLELGLGLVLFVVVAVPWYNAMLIKHGIGFWNEFFGDNYLHRAAGRHGDRGTFEYYILQIGQGMFPWTAFVAAGLLAALAKLKSGDGQRDRLRIFALVWFLVIFTVMSLVNTKFHHYILPGLPALAILAGLLIDDLVAHPKMGDVLALLLGGAPLLALAARDLAMFPARLLWLFCYDYVNAPNGGRAWPPGAEYDYKTRIAAFGIVVTAATVGFAILALLRARAAEKLEVDDDVAGPSPRATWLLALIPIAAVVAAQVWQPAFGSPPKPLSNGWILVGGAGSVFLALLLSPALGKIRSLGPALSLLAVGAVACFWTGWGLDRMLTDVSPHWSQKHVIAAYYQQRASHEEPLIAWQMYWRGENFYTKNVIYDHRIDQKDKTVFLGDHNAEKLQEYFKGHPGRRVFFIVERTRFEALRALLPEASRPSLKAVDDSNNKIYLAVATI